MGSTTSTSGADGPLNNEGSAPEATTTAGVVPAVALPPQATSESSAPMGTGSAPAPPAAGTATQVNGTLFPEPARPATGHQALIFALTDVLTVSDERTDRTVRLMNAATVNAMKLIGMTTLVFIALVAVSLGLMKGLHIPASAVYAADSLGVTTASGGLLTLRALKNKATGAKSRRAVQVQPPPPGAESCGTDSPPQPPAEPPPLRAAGAGDVEVPPPREEGAAAP